MDTVAHRQQGATSLHCSSTSLVQAAQTRIVHRAALHREHTWLQIPVDPASSVKALQLLCNVHQELQQAQRSIAMILRLLALAQHTTALQAEQRCAATADQQASATFKHACSSTTCYQKQQQRTWIAVKKSGSLRAANSFRLSPFSTMMIGGNGRRLRGGGKFAVLRVCMLLSMANTGGMILRMACTCRSILFMSGVVQLRQGRQRRIARSGA